MVRRRAVTSRRTILRLLVFKAGGTVALPPTKDYTPPPLNPPAKFGTAEVVKTGLEDYGKYCAACHGDRGQTRGANFPDPHAHAAPAFAGRV